MTADAGIFRPVEPTTPGGPAQFAHEPNTPTFSCDVMRLRAWRRRRAAGLKAAAADAEQPDPTDKR